MYPRHAPSQEMLRAQYGAEAPITAAASPGHVTVSPAAASVMAGAAGGLLANVLGASLGVAVLAGSGFAFAVKKLLG